MDTGKTSAIAKIAINPITRSPEEQNPYAFLCGIDLTLLDAAALDATAGHSSGQEKLI
jgi:hypothetical protein